MANIAGKFFPSLFSALGGLGGLACIFVWLGIKPGDLRMTATFPHVFWLVFGLFLFAVSISLSVLAWRSGKNTTAEAEIQRLKSALYESARSNLEYRGERDQCAEEKRVQQKQFDDMFSPPQIEALTLAKQLGELLAGIAPLKVISIGDYPDTPEGVAEYMTAWAQRCAANNGELAKVVDRYAREFAPRIKDAVLQFGQEGFNEPELRQFLDGVTTQDDLMRVRARLVCLAYRKNGVELSMRKPDEA